MKKYLILLGMCFCFALTSMAQQKQVRTNIRSGNRYYHQENLKKAESEYRKAYEVDSMNTQVLYNLGTDLLMQHDLAQAGKMLARAAETDKAKNQLKGTKVFHNLGVALQSAQQYDKAIQAYKQSLRYNPSDEETRYNLVLCQKLLKNQQQNQQNQQQQQKQDKKDDQKQQQQQQQDQKQDQQQQQQKQQEQEQNMSKENAKQLLEAVKQDEKDVKNRMNQQQARPKTLKKSKDW